MTDSATHSTIIDLAPIVDPGFHRMDGLGAEILLGFLMNDISRLLKQRFEDEVKAGDLDLTAGEARTLAYISFHEGRRQNALADLMCVEPMTLSVYIDKLEMKSLVIRYPDELDRRAKIIRLSAKGKSKMTAVADVLRTVSDQALRSIFTAKVDEILSALDTIRQNLVEEPNVPRPIVT